MFAECATNHLGIEQPIVNQPNFVKIIDKESSLGERERERVPNLLRCHDTRRVRARVSTACCIVYRSYRVCMCVYVYIKFVCVFEIDTYIL